MPTAKLDAGADLHPDTVVEWPFRTEGAVRIRTPARIGAYTFIRGCDIAAVESIGRYCSIGTGFRCGEVEYPGNWLASSPALYDQNAFNWALGKHQVRPAPELLPAPVIGNDVWIGSDVTVMRGVRIADGAIIATKACVTEDVPPYAVVEGVPARITRYRFAPEVIRVLLAVKWWDFDAYVLQDVPMEAPAKAVAMIMQLEKAGTIRRSPLRHQALVESARHKSDMKVLKTLDLPAEALASAGELLEDIERFLAKVALPSLRTPAPAVGDQHIVLSSNSGHSGTKSLSDYLSQSNVVQMPFGTGKLSCLQAKHGALAVLAKPTRANLCVFIRACVLGIPHEAKPTEIAARHAKQQALSRLFVHDPARMMALLAHAGALLRDAENGDMISALSRFLNSALRLRVNGPFVYIDNAIPQHLVKIFPLLENATCIAVMRDVRDQFVSRLTESKAAPVTTEAFIKRRLQVADAFSAVSHPRLWTISFEEFVRDEAVRQDLIEKLGIPPESISVDTARFDPALAQKRVGLHKEWPDQDAMRQLAEALPSLLHD